VGNRATRSVDPHRKCGGAKPCRGRKPEHGFAEPEPPTGGERLPFVVQSPAVTPIYFLF
jgi:hypothetical protein